MKGPQGYLKRVQDTLVRRVVSTVDWAHAAANPPLGILGCVETRKSTEECTGGRFRAAAKNRLHHAVTRILSYFGA